MSVSTVWVECPMLACHSEIPLSVTFSAEMARDVRVTFGTREAVCRLKIQNPIKPALDAILDHLRRCHPDEEWPIILGADQEVGKA